MTTAAHEPRPTASLRARRAPGPRGHRILGSLPDLRRDRLSFFLQAAMEHGDVVRIQAGPFLAHLVRDPEAVKHVLQDNSQGYDKQTRGFGQIRALLGDGLLTSEGSFWLRQRRIAQPAFHRQRIAGFADAMTRATTTMLDRWQPAIESGATLDIAAEMMRLTLQIVGETLLGTDVSGKAGAVGEALSYVLHHVNERLVALFLLPESLPTRANRKFKQAQATLNHVVNGMIQQRRGETTERNDLLSMLMHTRDEETGETMTDVQLRDEVMTMFVAGHETTANTLAWTFYLLSKNPHAYRALRQEVCAVLGPRLPTMADVPQLAYTLRVVQESMRLYPPAWMIGRHVLKDDVLGGYAIPAGSMVFASPYVTHRSPALWPNPEGFDPDRFRPEAFANVPRFAYFPFGGGPRQCIGNTFALMEAQLIVATMVHRVRLDLVPGSVVEPEPLITLRPRHGVPMTVHAAA